MSRRDKSNRCKFCGKVFFLKSCLVTHELNHKNEVEGEEEVEERKEILELTLHYEKKDISKRKKDISNSEFVVTDDKIPVENENSFDKENVVESGKGGSKFKCEECNKAFNLKSSYKTHLIGHKRVQSNICVLCNKTFSGQQNFKTHMLRHARKEYLQCPHCKLGFLSERRFQQHLNAHKSSNAKKVKKKVKKANGNDLNLEVRIKKEIKEAIAARKFTCRACFEEFSSRRELKDHYKQHKDNLECRKCQKKFSTLLSLKIHMKTHDTTSTLCEFCGKVVRSRNYRQHMNLHTGERPYKCKDCCETFVQNSHLKRHSRYHVRSDEPVKGDLKLHPCEYCSVSFYRAHHLKQHMDLHTNTGYSFQCYVCNHLSPSKSALRQHFKSHLESNPFECWYCDEKFAKSMALFRHERIHYPTEFPCQLCNHVFTSSSRLYAHYTGHSREDLMQLQTRELYLVYERMLNCRNCEVCGKNVRESFYKLHLSTHGEQKPLVCDICKKCFKTRQSLTMHSRIHTGEKPYQCNVCSKSFSQRGHLNVHLSLHSSKKPYHCRYCGKAFATQNYVSNHERKTCKGSVIDDGQNGSVSRKGKNEGSDWSHNEVYYSKNMIIKDEPSFVDEDSNFEMVPVPSIHCLPLYDDRGIVEGFEDSIEFKTELDVDQIIEIYEQ